MAYKEEIKQAIKPNSLKINTNTLKWFLNQLANIELFNYD